ncbi:hypothetical protein [Propionispora sp. 2/2-37]|uniref:hypothetical protein n=1 Tax=Propionispora sp. 2/2-37 TaxID=1677858 RepID=UPI001C0F4C01|nr:hypothetical protein [Propionispora sp. 2/2-37]
MERKPAPAKEITAKPLPSARTISPGGKLKNGHNPFIIPPEFVPVFAKEEKGNALGISEKNTSEKERSPAREASSVLADLTVTGIALGDKQKLAVINNGTTVKSYRPGEAVGNYRIEEITEDSVIVIGPLGRQKLLLSSNLSGADFVNTEGTDRGNGLISKTAE